MAAYINTVARFVTVNSRLAKSVGGTSGLRARRIRKTNQQCSHGIEASASTARRRPFPAVASKRQASPLIYTAPP